MCVCCFGLFVGLPVKLVCLDLRGVSSFCSFDISKNQFVQTKKHLLPASFLHNTHEECCMADEIPRKNMAQVCLNTEQFCSQGNAFELLASLVGICKEPGGVPPYRRNRYNGPYNPGSKVLYLCHQSLECQSNGSWSGTAANCTGTKCLL